jgi:hypothetical protein
VEALNREYNTHDFASQMTPA